MTPLAHLRAIGTTPFAYLFIASMTTSLTRFEGGVAFIWVANALLIARLFTMPNRDWMTSIVTCAIASAPAMAVFAIGPASAVPMAAVNMGEVYVAASLIRRTSLPAETMESLRWLAVFVLAIGLLSPAVGALGAGLVVWFVTGGRFRQTYFDGSPATRWAP